MSRTRKFYYWLVGRLSSDVELVHNFTGFGLYDREVIEQFRSTDEQYPYFRGLVSDFGYERAEIPYVQPARTQGKTKNNFFSLYDMAMLGITNHSKVPLRLATMAGFAISVISLLVAIGYLVAKLMFWDELQLGLAPLLIGIYFFGAVQLFFIGVLGEYIGCDPHPGPQATARRREGAHQLRLSCASTKPATTWYTNSWHSWILAVSLDGTARIKSQSSSIRLAPGRPVKPMVTNPWRRAAFNAARTFAEPPLVDIASSTSPGRPSAST